jgi:hypothetical protein
VTPGAFRKLALALPDAEERSHMSHPDFRVRGKIFATLSSPDTSFGMVQLTNAQQDMLCKAEPASFVPVPGGWGARGATRVILKHAKVATVRDALAMAWKNAEVKARGRTRAR